MAAKYSGLMIDVGFGNVFPVDRILGIVAYDSDPMRRHCDGLEKEHKVIDATRGRKVKSVLILDSSHVVLSPIARETLAERFQNSRQASEAKMV
ncbi:MAG: DUF370 domain-containing protein [Proteobacteria bacterium]|jgi:regulator of extracellular matrix RemA (YlzA/DUF370 family)|nr:DUF370 domain-containing protein [Pseudomonadota bacterium]